ncbi:TMV resistance protein N-like [Corylus avellana]|uniref:TMV resistance protein N-like n=1 Tax=Corylus avellana TaxID=13451 RepID=UPI00286D13DF|nr:TMV resistance protein N-like [Corylus avellana]
MASTTTQRPSSSSSSTPSRRYDVFLSFYGEDTRKSFTDHLHAALKQRGILVFRDDEKLERGKYVSKELLKAIQDSKYGIAIISPNYASSRWCLIELAKMVKCMRNTGRVLPIFYHVDPSDVGNQRGAFAEAFGRHEKDPKVDIQMMSKWRAALREVSKISGWHVHDRHESIVVEEISRRVLSGLSRNFSIVSKDFVGIESRVEEIMNLLSIGLDDVRFLGIYGMGGIGKTTLSKAIYERVSHQFDASCFITDIREETRTHGLVYLQKQLIVEILMEREINIWNEYGASRVIVNRLRNKKVFIILDDVDEVKQLEALAGSHDWFGQGSRIIITSRDQHLLNRFVDNTYEVMNLNYPEALQLFSWKAFKKPHPEENYVQLSMNVVSYAQGLPLALEVFGSFLFGRTMDEWKNIACFFHGANMYSSIHKLESFGYYPNINIRVLVDKSLITISNERLQMHNLLQKMGQQIVHCESAEEPGERSRLWHIEDVLHVLKNNTGTDTVKGIVLKLPLQKLEQLNFEAFSKMKKLKMLEISGVGHLRTNLEWHGDPSNFMLSNELCIIEWWEYPFESLPASFQPKNLVMLKMPYSCIKQLWDKRKIFDKLKHICLSHSQNLIETLDLSGFQNLEKLELAYCTSLSKVHPSIGFLRRLKELHLQGCKRLKRLPDEICLESLEVFNLSGCSRLNKLPLSFKRLSSLKNLNISNCSRLEKIPKNMISGMKCLEHLWVGGNATRKLPIGSGPDPIISLLLPDSFSGLSSLRELDLSYHNLSNGNGVIANNFSCLSSLCSLNLSWSKFTRIIDGAWQLSNLEWLDLSYCNLLDGAMPSDLSCLPLLRILKLSGNKFTRIQDCVAQLSRLYSLELDDCSWLQVLPKLPLGLISLSVRNCPSLELFYKQMEMWSSNEKLRSIDGSFVAAYIDYDGTPSCKILRLHPRSPLWSKESFQTFYDLEACGPALVGSGIPKWFKDKSSNWFGRIQLHTDFSSVKWWTWKGYALFIVYEIHEPRSTHPRKRRKLKVDEWKENSNSTTIFDGSNSNLPNFVCQFQVNEVDVTEPLALCAPGFPSIGSSGFWVYIPANWFLGRRVGNSFVCGWNNLKASITTACLNVEVKEFGARVVRDQSDYSEFCQVVNTISPHGLDFKSTRKSSFDLVNGYLFLHVDGPIKSML